jgi:hypothetical protein
VGGGSREGRGPLRGGGARTGGGSQARGGGGVPWLSITCPFCADVAADASGPSVAAWCNPFVNRSRMLKKVHANRLCCCSSDRCAPWACGQLRWCILIVAACRSLSGAACVRKCVPGQGHGLVSVACARPKCCLTRRGYTMQLPCNLGPGAGHILVKGCVASFVAVRLDLGPPAASAAVVGVASRQGVRPFYHHPKKLCAGEVEQRAGTP